MRIHCTDVFATSGGLGLQKKFQPADAEICQHQLIQRAVQQQVLWLEVQHDDALCMKLC